MPIESLSGARAALRRNDAASLIGLAECEWLDAKLQAYDLKNPAKAEEMAKDVAAFANTPDGGLLVIGFRTQPDGHGEILSQLTPIPRTSANADQIRKIIRERITPPPRNISVFWVSQDGEEGILVIDIPEQPRGCLPHAVAAPTGKPGQVNPSTLAVPVREADSTHWLPRTELHRLLAAGWMQAGGPTKEMLAALIEQALDNRERRQIERASEPSEPAHEVGAREPSWTRQFQLAHKALRELTTVGPAVTDVYWDGPGVAQAFAPTASSPGWVLCALPNQNPVAIAESIWQELHEAGSNAIGFDAAMSAVGYPVLDQIQAYHPIAEDAQSVTLRGGSWGGGRLVRDSLSDGWRWQPDLTFSFNMTRASQYWTANRVVPTLRIRAVATLPWANARQLQLPEDAHKSIQGSLPFTDFASAIRSLSRKRGADIRSDVWRNGSNRNDSGSLSLVTEVVAPTLDVALEAEVMLSLPNSHESALVSCAELRIYDHASWSEAIAATGGEARMAPISLDELCSILASAWEMATEKLPSAVTDGAADMRWAGVPVIELRITAEHPHDSPPPHPLIPDLVDLSPFGTTDRDYLSTMSITITAPCIMDHATRLSFTRQALVHMARGFGYLGAKEELI